MLPCKASINCVDNDSAYHGSVALSIGFRRSRIPLGERMSLTKGRDATARFLGW